MTTQTPFTTATATDESTPTKPAENPASVSATTHTGQLAPTVRLVGATSEVDEQVLLQPTSFSIYPGQVVGIAGGSGAGKTTLLEIIAGGRKPSSGHVEHSDDTIAFVPQDDIIHGELPLRRTLEYAAALRIQDLTAERRAELVEHTLRRLDLAERADVIVSQLSGGQRKRASLAAEMLTEPRMFFLDEPTSGLDPANAAELMTSLRGLAADGSTVVLSTHSPADLDRCDRIVFVARGGRVAFAGSPEEALSFFGVSKLVDIYELLDESPTEGPLATMPTDTSTIGQHTIDPQTGVQQRGSETTPTSGPGVIRQWLALTRRNVDLIKGNGLTLAILAGSPIFVIGMMTTLFPAGAFDPGAASSSMAIQTIFWLAFNSFFFGLTYGLLQVVGEFEIIRREHRVGLRLDAYVASKFTVLLPLLAVVNATQLFAMEATDRLPDTSLTDKAALFVSLQLLSSAAVAIGLHASSAVQNASQAALALPMLCFPQVLFAGAVVPVSEMGWFPKLMSAPLGSRWAFESVGRTLDLAPAAAAEPATAGFAPAFTGSPATGWAVLTLLMMVGAAGTVRTLRRRSNV